MNPIIQFILGHQVVLSNVLSMLVVAILDFLFAVNKNLESNGLLHSLYLLAKNSIQKAPSQNGSS